MIIDVKVLQYLTQREHIKVKGHPKKESLKGSWWNTKRNEAPEQLLLSVSVSEVTENHFFNLYLDVSVR